MNPVTHLLASWLVANTTDLNRRDRAIVTIAGIVPDMDSFGIIPEMLTRNSAHPLRWWTDYHHVIGHNIGFALLVAVVGFLLSARRWKTALLVFVSFHIHLLGDLLGARGPEGYQWPIPYLLPFSDSLQLAWPGQWALNAWPNLLITAMALALTLLLAAWKGFSPLEIISVSADKKFIETLRRRFTK